MQNKKLDILNKGKFQKIDNDFMVEGTLALRELQKVQEKFHRNDTDSFINELRDQIVGYKLGFDLVNADKHGFDCKMSNDRYFLEVKAASFDSSSWGATFNDTTLEKAEAFKDEKIYLALAIWKDASDLLFICFGQNEEVGNYLEEKVKWFKAGNTVRSTQTISFTKLVFDFGFKIYSVDREDEDVLKLIQDKFSNTKITKNNFITYDEIYDILHK